MIEFGDLVHVVVDGRDQGDDLVVIGTPMILGKPARDVVTVAGVKAIGAPVNVRWVQKIGRDTNAARDRRLRFLLQFPGRLEALR